MREKTPKQDMPDLENMASATECTGILPALNADEDRPKGPRARLKQRERPVDKGAYRRL